MASFFPDNWYKGLVSQLWHLSIKNGVLVQGSCMFEFKQQYLAWESSKHDSPKFAYNKETRFELLALRRMHLT